MTNENTTAAKLSHLEADGAARMVDILAKELTDRVAIAKGLLRMSSDAAAAIRDGSATKGDVLQIARIAAIQGAKRTSDLIPLCHVILIEKVSVSFDWKESLVLQCTAEVKTTGKTGVEMEALTAVSVGLLTVYDMLKGIDKSMCIESIELWKKDGGKSGPYQREGTK
jgi:cyclic pyranopterin monophosphate synthase